MRVVVLVPRRSDGGRRDEVWNWVKARWRRELPYFTLYEGHHTEGDFNRSYAINRAADAASDWDIAVIADADSFVGRNQLLDAIGVAHEKQQMTLAYDQFCALSEDMTQKILEGYLGNWYEGLIARIEGTCSSMVVVPRNLWDTVGGFDETFVSWGGEDVGAFHAFITFGDGWKRIPGPVWHMHHPPAPRRVENWTGRIGKYAEASGDKEAMRYVLDHPEFGRDS